METGGRSGSADLPAPEPQGRSMGSGHPDSRCSSALACCGQCMGHVAPRGLNVLTHKIWLVAQVGPEALLPKDTPRSTH